jgi:hypothetical protein
MPALVAGIHVFLVAPAFMCVNSWDKPGHDDKSDSYRRSQQ